MESLKPIPDLNTRQFHKHPKFCRRPHIILITKVLVVGFSLQHNPAAAIAGGKSV
jgi:hypothetical protein